MAVLILREGYIACRDFGGGAMRQLKEEIEIEKAKATESDSDDELAPRMWTWTESTQMMKAKIP